MSLNGFQRLQIAQRHGWRLTGHWRQGAVAERTLKTGRVVRLWFHQYFRVRVLQ